MESVSSGFFGHLTSKGLWYEYDETEVLGALNVADSISLMSTIELAGLAKNQ